MKCKVLDCLKEADWTITAQHKTGNSITIYLCGAHNSFIFKELKLTLE